MALTALYDVPAPAKLNLFLHVTGRRDDGYHLLQSFFQLIDWQDRLHFDLRHDGQLSREDLGPALPADDLSLRAARALQQASGTAIGVHIGIEKRVPWGAGLGGGSSDAATTLLALNRLWRLDWPRERLLAIGETLGADVPFFIGGHNAWVEGIGEQLTPVDLLREAGDPRVQDVIDAGLVVLKPPAAVPTAAIFGDNGLPRSTPHARLAVFLATPFGFGRNDLQQSAILYEKLRYEELRSEEQQYGPGTSSSSGSGILTDIGLAVDLLERSFGNARMTGSGSAVFAWAGLVPDSPPADSHLQQLLATLPQGWSGRWCRALAHHPLRDWAPG